MKMVKIKLPNGVDVFVNVDNVCDVRSDPMDDKNTLIQLNQGTHKVKLSVPEVLKLLGAKNIS